jgi:serine/threonine protein kinase
VIGPITKQSIRVLEKKWNFADAEYSKELLLRLNSVFDLMYGIEFLLFSRLNNAKVSFDKDCDQTIKGFFVPYGQTVPISVPYSEALTCVLQIAKIVKTLISLRIIHHDISLDNIVKYRDSYILVDFDDAFITDADGRCKAFSSQKLSRDKHAAETYIRHGHEVDVWAIGYLLKKFRLTDNIFESQLIILAEDIINNRKAYAINMNALISKIENEMQPIRRNGNFYFFYFNLI